MLNESGGATTVAGKDLPVHVIKFHITGELLCYNNMALEASHFQFSVLKLNACLATQLNATQLDMYWLTTQLNSAQLD